MTRILFAALAIALSATLFAQRDRRHPHPPPAPQPAYGSVSLNATGWTTISTPQRYPLSNDATGALAFAIRPSPSSMGYLYHASPSKALAGQLVVSLRVSTSESAVVVATPEPGNTCGTPATVRLLIWAHNGSWAENDRWWSNPLSAPLIANTLTLTVPVTPAQWSNVNGHFGTASPAGWTAALSNVSHLGLTFGGGCFFGHGVSLAGTGSAMFTLLRYGIER